jgi:hypothetical protein
LRLLLSGTIFDRAALERRRGRYGGFLRNVAASCAVNPGARSIGRAVAAVTLGRGCYG